MRLQIKKLISTLTACLLILPSCKSNTEQASPGDLIDTSQFSIIDSEEYERDYKEFRQVISDNFENTTLEIMTLTSNREVHKNVIKLRQFLSRRSRNMNEDDPRLAALNTWAFLRRMKIYFKRGEGSFLFGKSQALMLSMLDQTDKDFELFALKYMDEKAFQKVSRIMDQYVKQNPIKDIFSEKATDDSNTFSEVMDYGLTPFKAIGAVRKGGQGIEDIAKTTERFTDIVEDLPEDIRWQLHVLALQLQENKILKDNTETLRSLAVSFENMNKIMAKYPELLSLERKNMAQDMHDLLGKVSKVTQDVKASSVNIKNSSKNFQQVGKDINQASEKITASIKQVEQSSIELTKAATAVSKTIKDIQGITEFFKGDPNKPKEPKDPNKPSFLLQVEHSANALHKTAQELNTAIAQIQKTINNNNFSKELEVVDQISKQAIDTTRQEAEVLVDYIFKKALIFVAITFTLCLILILIKKRKKVKVA